jgi:Nif-specific regulatory protein
MPISLLESELFGYKKGAFTGATSDKEGLFESANGGTLFIDEVGNLSHEIQTKLLRVIQEGEIRRVGDTELRKIDVRLITASNKELNELVRQGKFRSDLYYRLNVINIKLPPLRERKEDIPLLAHHFLEKYAKKYNKIVKGFTKEAIEYLESNRWPGNVRELENCIERAIIMTEKEVISLDSLTSEKREPNELIDYDTAKAKFERTYIINMLKATHGNVSKAAKLANRPRRTLYDSIKKYNITPQEFRK